MTFIHPFEGYLVGAKWAAGVVAPAYDALTPEERRRHADRHPESYLHAMRSVDEYGSDEAPSASAILSRNARFLRRYVEAGRFSAQSQCVLVYRIASHGHVQRGVVAEMPIGAYLDGRIKRHEFTHVAREDALAEYIARVRAASSPVSLAFRADEAIRCRLDAATRTPAAVSHVTEDGVEHDIWVLGGGDADSIISAFGSVSTAYLTDGHHRCAATARFATAGADARLLVVLFPDDELRILPYHRVVRDLGAHSSGSFLDVLSESFSVEPLPDGDPDAAQPRVRGEFAVHLDRRWYRFRSTGNPALPDAPEDAIDAAILQSRVIGPLLGITDPETTSVWATCPAQRGSSRSSAPAARVGAPRSRSIRRAWKSSSQWPTQGG